jgi:hypothetical protein
MLRGEGSIRGEERIKKHADGFTIPKPQLAVS